MDKPRSILERWELTVDELTELVDANPSLRGMMSGYIAEKKFHDRFLSHPDITEIAKDDDHDRKMKGDRRILYKGKKLTSRSRVYRRLWFVNLMTEPGSVKRKSMLATAVSLSSRTEAL